MRSVSPRWLGPPQAADHGPWPRYPAAGFRGLGRDVSGARGDGVGGDPTGRALARLEAAVERLAQAAARPRGETAADMVPRAHVAAIADRLDETIARLRSALGEEH